MSRGLPPMNDQQKVFNVRILRTQEVLVQVYAWDEDDITPEFLMNPHNVLIEQVECNIQPVEILHVEED